MCIEIRSSAAWPRSLKAGIGPVSGITPPEWAEPSRSKVNGPLPGAETSFPNICATLGRPVEAESLPSPQRRGTWGTQELWQVYMPGTSVTRQMESNSPCTSLSGRVVSAATANIPSHRLRAEKAPLEQSRLFPCCDLTRKRKRTRPCNDCPTSSLHMILVSGKDGCLITLEQCEPGAPGSPLKPSFTASCAERSSRDG